MQCRPDVDAPVRCGPGAIGFDSYWMPAFVNRLPIQSGVAEAPPGRKIDALVHQVPVKPVTDVDSNG